MQKDQPKRITLQNVHLAMCKQPKDFKIHESMSTFKTLLIYMRGHINKQ